MPDGTARDRMTARRWVAGLVRASERWLPFADAATAEVPLARLLRLGLFQVSVGITFALLAGTLNRVMIVELGVPASLVALMLAIPLLFAPARALVGFRSDTYRSALGWKRVPFIWFGTMLQWGGLAIMPFALILLSGDTNGTVLEAQIASALAFLLVGAGTYTVQTAGLALATDLVPERARPRAVALLYVLLLVGMVVGSLGYGRLLQDFSQVRLVGVVQGSAVVALVLNVIALWKQEARVPGARRTPDEPRPSFREAWRSFSAAPRVVRYLVALAFGTAAFGMQDVLLEPYGGQVLGLGVGATTELTALMAGGSILAFVVAARSLEGGLDAIRLAAFGAIVGVLGFAAIVFAAPLDSAAVFRVGTALVGIGSGAFAVAMLTSAMALQDREGHGLALGAWGAVQATAAGLAVASGGVLRDIITSSAERGVFGAAAPIPLGYSVVYHLEIALLFATLVALGPLAVMSRHASPTPRRPFGLADLPA